MTVGPLVLVFDMDDTLYPEQDFCNQALLSLSGLFEQHHGIKGFGQTCSDLFARGYRQSIFQAAASQLDVDKLSDAFVSELLQSYREFAPAALPWFPDAFEVVRQLRESHQLAIVTDGYLPTQKNKAIALGLYDISSHIVFSEELGRHAWKPSRLPFEVVATFFKGENLFVYIGDNPRKDFIAPRSLGWGTVRVRRADTEHYNYNPNSQEAADFEIASFCELPNVLSSFMANSSISVSITGRNK